MRSIIVRASRIFEIVFITGLIVFFFAKTFLPSVSESRIYPSHFEITSDKIVFYALLNNKVKEPFNLVGIDTRRYFSSFAFWNVQAFQTALDESSILLSGLDLKILQEWILNNNVNYFNKPFPGKISLIFDKEPFRSIDYREIITNFSNLSLENIIFIGLGLESFIDQVPPQESTIIDYNAFLRSYFNKQSARVKISNDALPQKKSKVKIIISL